MRRDDIQDEIIAAIVAYLNDDGTLRAFVAAMSPVVVHILQEEVKAAEAVIGVGDLNIDTDTIVAEWVRGLPTKIAGVNEYTQQVIRNIIIDGFKQDQTISQISSRIDEVFGKMGRVRANAIARTEALGASNFAAWSSYRQIAVPFKRWLAVMDDRVRDTHADANDQIATMTDPFIVGGEWLMYPGDPSGSAKEVINCRCTIVPEWNPERSIWTNKHAAVIWKSYFIRTSTYEQQLQTAVRSQFEMQKNHVDIILNHFSKL